jgi:hypothetical protein
MTPMDFDSFFDTKLKQAFPKWDSTDYEFDFWQKKLEKVDRKSAEQALIAYFEKARFNTPKWPEFSVHLSMVYAKKPQAEIVRDGRYKSFHIQCIASKKPVRLGNYQPVWYPAEDNMYDAINAELRLRNRGEDIWKYPEGKGKECLKIERAKAKRATAKEGYSGKTYLEDYAYIWDFIDYEEPMDSDTRRENFYNQPAEIEPVF